MVAWVNGCVTQRHCPQKKVRFRRTLANVLAMVGRKEVAAVVDLWPNKESAGAGGVCDGQ